jgi:hypothetical protein
MIYALFDRYIWFRLPRWSLECKVIEAKENNGTCFGS